MRPVAGRVTSLFILGRCRCISFLYTASRLRGSLTLPQLNLSMYHLAGHDSLLRYIRQLLAHNPRSTARPSLEIAWRSQDLKPTSNEHSDAPLMTDTSTPESHKEHTHHILLVDDDPNVAESLVVFLESHGWVVTVAATGSGGLDMMERERDLDLVLLDINLPDINGFELLKRSQEIGIVAPVIVISTRTEDRDQLHAFGLGAQDYFTKPFDPDTLVARIETFLGTGDVGAAPAGRHKVGDATVDLERGEVHRGDETKSLAEPQRDLLMVMLRDRGQTISSKRLLHEGLGIDEDSAMLTMTRRVLREMLHAEISRLRQLVEPDPQSPRHIEEVYGQGYRLRAD